MLKETLNLEDFLKCLCRRDGIQKLALTVQESFQSWFHSEKWGAWRDMDEFTRHVYAHHPYKSILKIIKSQNCPDEEKGISDLAEFIRSVGMPPGRLLSPSGNKKPVPFDKFAPGKTVYVCIAKRRGQYIEGGKDEEGWQRFVHGARDVLALADLVDILGRKVRLEYQLGLVSAPPSPLRGMDLDRPMQDAENMLDELIKEKNAGAIISLGSGPHNLVSNAIAKRIFAGFGDKIPVRFRWTTEHWSQIDFLNETPELRTKLSGEEAGVWYLGEKTWSLVVRDTDGAVRAKIKGARKRNVFLLDCGVLAIDARNEVPLIMAAGHGGNATRACVKALGSANAIAKYMEGRKERRFIGCVVVARKKPTAQPIDDVTLLSEEKYRGWYFFDMDELPGDIPFQIMPLSD